MQKVIRKRSKKRTAKFTLTAGGSKGEKEIFQKGGGSNEIGEKVAMETRGQVGKGRR